MDDIHLILDCIETSGKKVLATIIEVEGSSYKKAGASMLFLEHQVQKGMLSAGCLEMDLAARTEEVWKSGKAITIQFDMSDETDENWGGGNGCAGMLTILLEPIDEKLTADFVKVKSFLTAKIPVFMFKKIATEIEYLFLPFEGEPFGWWQGEIPAAIEENGQSTGMIPGTSIFQHLLQPRPRLFVFGAGPDARPLVSLAAKSGYSVTVCDWREEFCSRWSFPDAEHLILGFPRDVLPKFSFIHDDLIVIMTHNFQKDREILEAILKENVKYIGVLGPRERTKRLLRQKEIPAWIHSPAGVSIGAIGSVEIAVSIVAQLIEVCRKPAWKEKECLWMIPE